MDFKAIGDVFGPWLGIVVIVLIGVGIGARMLIKYYTEVYGPKKLAMEERKTVAHETQAENVKHLTKLIEIMDTRLGSVERTMGERFTRMETKVEDIQQDVSAWYEYERAQEREQTLEQPSRNRRRGERRQNP